MQNLMVAIYVWSKNSKINVFGINFEWLGDFWCNSFIFHLIVLELIK